MPLSRRDALKLGLAATAVAAVGSVAMSSSAEASIDANGTASPGATTLAGSVTLAKLTIPAGSTVVFDPAVNTTLQVTGNVVVDGGTLRMRPNPGVVHRLQFVGIDESKFVGGGSVVLDSDVGLWVIHNGVLDAVGQPKAGWNRTGTNPTWAAGDELRTAPQAVGQYSTCPSFTLGGTVPKITKFGVDYPTEVFNLTRTVIIGGTPSGRAHVAFLGGSAMTSAPQTIKWVRFENVGPRKVTPTGKPLPGPQTSSTLVIGRYGLHFHHCMDGTVGSLIEGVVVANCGTRAFVPHASNGITFRDCIAYDVAQDGYWWDPSDASVDNSSSGITYDRCAAFRILPPADSADGGQSSGFELPTGSGNSAISCVAAASSGSSGASGFIWPETARRLPTNWTFTDCVAHNNNSHGVFFWQNDPQFLEHHQMTGFTGYRNFWANIGHGAYVNHTTYTGVTAWGISRTADAGSFIQGLVAGGNLVDSRLDAEGGPYPCILISHHSITALASHPPNLFRNVAMSNPGSLRAVQIAEAGTNASKDDFVNCTVNGADLQPTDFMITYMAPATIVRVQRRDGTAYRLNPDGTGTPIPAFA